MEADQSAEPEAPTSWRELAVARSLDSARVRAENRVQRFLDAALDLMHSAPEKEFTVQEVVELSGQSLRSFYQYFAGKHELLLALFEESVRSTADELRVLVDAEEDPLERLRIFATEYYRLCRPLPKGRQTKRGPTLALAEFAQQLLTSHPTEASLAFTPLVELFERVLQEGADAGVIRARLTHSHIAGIVLEAIMFNAFSTTIGGVSPGQERVDPAEELWDLILHGIGVN